jgi:hypothetical protein
MPSFYLFLSLCCSSGLNCGLHWWRYDWSDHDVGGVCAFDVCGQWQGCWVVEFVVK